MDKEQVIKLYWLKMTSPLLMYRKFSRSLQQFYFILPKLTKLMLMIKMSLVSVVVVVEVSL